MRTFSQLQFRSWLAASVAVACLPALADDSEGVVQLNRGSKAGVVRISDAPRETVVRGQSPEHQTVCRHGVPAGQQCPTCQPPLVYEHSSTYIPPVWEHHDVLGEGPLCEFLAASAAAHRARNQAAAAMFHFQAQEECNEKSAWLHHKFGYLIPSGCCGKGCPPIGAYSMVYPVDPNYFDQRDGQVYAAAGYGGPVAVPLAPVVNHTYNYGWGVPSSRLTPVSHPTPVVRPVPLPIANH